MKILILCEKKLTFENDKKFLNKFKEIHKIIKKNNIRIKGLNEIENILKNKKFHVTQNLKYFKYNFGRELFYISLIKNL